MFQGYTKRVSRVSQLSLENTEGGGIEASVTQTLSIASRKFNTCSSKGFWEVFRSAVNPSWFSCVSNSPG